MKINRMDRNDRRQPACKAIICLLNDTLQFACFGRGLHFHVAECEKHAVCIERRPLLLASASLNHAHSRFKPCGLRVLICTIAWSARAEWNGSEQRPVDFGCAANGCALIRQGQESLVPR